MSNLVAFNSVAERAARAEEGRESFNESIRINVPTSVIMFADLHIRMMEEQQAKMQKELNELRALVACGKVHYAKKHIDSGNHQSLK